MSLQNKETGRTAAEEIAAKKSAEAERKKLEQDVAADRDNAELQMLRTLNKRLALKDSENDERQKRFEQNAARTLEQVRNLASDRLTEMLEISVRFFGGQAERGREVCVGLVRADAAVSKGAREGGGRRKKRGGSSFFRAAAE